METIGMGSTLQILHEYLISDPSSSLYALVGTRVWEQAPRDWNNTEPCLLMNLVSDESHMQNAQYEAYVQIDCYGASDVLSDATEVYDALKEVLNGVKSENVDSGCLVLASHRNGIGVTVEDDTEWPLQSATYRVVTK